MVKKNSPVDERETYETLDRSKNSRRGFLKGSVGIIAGTAAAQLHPSQVGAQQNVIGFAERLRAANASGHPILLRGGIVLTMDPMVGDFAKADVLIQGKKITSVGPNLASPSQTIVVNAAGLIVMPGFVDTHHHQYETVLRSILADGKFAGRMPARNYGSVIGQTFSPLYTPEDARIAELIASLSQINDGVTTVVDTSQIQLTPEHTDACIAGLKESGRRCLFSYVYGPNGLNDFTKTAAELARIKKQYFSSADQLLTLAANTIVTPEAFQMARAAGVPTVSHCQGGPNFNEPAIIRSGLMGPEDEYIHCTHISKELFDAIAATGGHVSIATTIEMQMGHGYPPVQECLDRGIRPSLSVDVECNMTADSFTQMRECFTWQRVMVNERINRGEENVPPMLNCRDVIEFATLAGAKCAHLDSKIGTLTPGKEADIILLTTGLNVTQLNNVPGAVVTLMDTSNVDSVFIAGKVMKWQGKLVGVDVSKVLQEANRSAEGLIARSGYSNSLFETCCTGPMLTGAERAAISLDQIKRGH